MWAEGSWADFDIVCYNAATLPISEAISGFGWQLYICDNHSWHVLDTFWTLLSPYLCLGGGDEVSQNSVSSPFSHNSSGTIRSTHLLTLEQCLPKRPDSFRPSSKALIPLVSFKKKIKTSLVPQGSLLYHTGSCLNLQINQLNPPTPTLAVHGLVWDKVWKHRLTERC